MPSEEPNRHPAHEGRLIDAHGNVQPQREFTDREIEESLERLRNMKRQRGEEPDF